MMYTVYQSWFHQGIDGELNWLALYGCIVTGLSVDKVMGLMGIEQPRGTHIKRVPAHIKRQIYDMRTSGMPYVNIAEQLGYTVDYVRNTYSEERKKHEVPNR